MNAFSKRSRSRDDKSQIAAHLPAELAVQAKRYCEKRNLSRQELVAMAVNRFVGDQAALRKEPDPGPFLRVYCNRRIHRRNALAAVRKEGPECRIGTTRIAAFFTNSEVDRVRTHAKEIGIRQEQMIRDGIQAILGDAAAAEVKTAA